MKKHILLSITLLLSAHSLLGKITEINQYNFLCYSWTYLRSISYEQTCLNPIEKFDTLPNDNILCAFVNSPSLWKYFLFETEDDLETLLRQYFNGSQTVKTSITIYSLPKHARPTTTLCPFRFNPRWPFLGPRRH